MRKIVSIVLLAILGVSTLGFLTNLGSAAGVQIEGTWVHMRGFITQWGANSVFGWVGAVAGMVDKSGAYYEWARAHAVWSEDVFGLNRTEPPIENYNFTCYGARLVNMTDVNLEGTSFTLSGYWDVAKITVSVTIIKDESGEVVKISWEYTIEKIVENAEGQLQASLTPPKFTLSIAGIDTLSGTVKFIIIKYKEIEICDISGDGKVNIIDLVKVAKRYRAVPGLWCYEHSMDVNFDNVIDIGDLTTIAANIEG
ncbi:hypothetical protein KEJ32_02010 [Candidatus Bathyarchaeota archaeon]|nr:hypothetical protein [Candidatus Bathyarchaeota archaeon]